MEVRAVDVIELLPKPALDLKRARVYHVPVFPTPETQFAGGYTVRCDGGDEVPGGEDPGRVGGDLDPRAYLWFGVRLERSEGGWTLAYVVELRGLFEDCDLVACALDTDGCC